jgi:DNA-binding MarR family transcriptional regulator
MADHPDSSCGEAALPAPVVQAWVGFLRAYRAVVGDLDAQLEWHHHLPLSEFEVLLTLDRSPDRPLRMSELADAVLLSRSGLTRLVDRLEQGGFVERFRCPSDRRGMHAAITASGRDVLQAARATHFAGVRERFADRLTDDELDLLGSIFARLAAPAADAVAAAATGLPPG